MTCKKCGSKFGYVRLKKKEWICRTCGEVSEIKTIKKIAKDFAGFH